MPNWYELARRYGPTPTDRDLRERFEGYLLLLDSPEAGAEDAYEDTLEALRELRGIATKHGDTPFTRQLKNRIDAVLQEYATQKNPRFTQTQSVLIPRDEYTLARAKSWLRRHNLKTSPFDETDRYYRFRQASLKKFDRLRTIALSNTGGIKLIVGWFAPRVNPLERSSSQSDLDELVGIIYEMLLVRRGEIITEDVALERARNITVAIGHAIDMGALR